MRTVFLFSVLIVALVHGFDHSIKLSDQYTLSWSISNGKITFQASVQTTGWIGFGLSTVQVDGLYGMPLADIWVGIWDDNGRLTVRDYFRNSNTTSGQPSDDMSLGGTNDILSFNGSQANGISTINFVRNLVTPDSRWDHPITSGPQNWIWAFGATNKFGFHGLDNIGRLPIDLFAPSPSE